MGNNTLTAYQNKTVEHLKDVYGNQKAYIVADEVGLGKTFVAIGLIESLKAKRIIYIASNSEIAKQNVKKISEKIEGLNILDGDRLSLINTAETKIAENKEKKYILSLSPATTFTGKGSPVGNENERNEYINKLNNLKFEGNEKEIRDNVINELKKYNDYKQDDYKIEGSTSPLTDKFAPYIKLLREYFNNLAIKEYEPDLIIMDEFHRFHSLLRQTDKQTSTDIKSFKLDDQKKFYKFKDSDKIPEYSMWGVLPDECKILLLSATPYNYVQDVDLHKYDDKDEIGKKEFAQSKDSCEPFGNFQELVKYLDAINNKNTANPRDTDINNIDDIYNRIMCRTQRNWLGIQQKNKTKINTTVGEKDIEALSDHFDYLECVKNNALISENAKILSDKTKETKMPYDINQYLDQAPAFEQFASGYKFSDGANKSDVVSNRKKYSDNLLQNDREKQGTGYLIRRKIRDNDEVEPEPFKQCLKDYKTKKLLEIAMPEQSELLLWVIPTMSLSKDKAWNPIGIGPNNIEKLKAFSKTLVFAHYKLSTAAVPAVMSMEANRRLNSIIEDVGEKYKDEINKILKLDNLEIEPDARYKYVIETSATLLLKNKNINENDKKQLCEKLKKTLTEYFSTLFETEYSKKVLAAWASIVNSSPNNPKEITSQNVIEEYSRNFLFEAMLTEYSEVLGDKEFAGMILGKENEKHKIIPSVLQWSDNDRTRVIIFPDFTGDDNSGDDNSGDTYPLTFGERYTSDYSDKGSNDKNKKDKDSGVFRNTSLRLEYIRCRFQSPFYPFVLCASETAQEGVDLHNYSTNIVHWSVPASVRVYTQEEGRVDRRNSLSVRRQMVYLYNQYIANNNSQLRSLVEIFNKAHDICKQLGLESDIENAEKSGLFPYWELPASEEKTGLLESKLLYLPFGPEKQEYDNLAISLENYVTFGIKDDKGNLLKDESLRDGLCPYFHRI